MTKSTTCLTTALLACVAMVPAVAHAQGGRRITVEPQVSGLPEAGVYRASRSVTAVREVGVPAGSGDVTTTATRSARLTRAAMPLLGGRITVGAPGSAWHVAIDGAAGKGTMRAEVTQVTAFRVPGAETDYSNDFAFRDGDLPLSLAQLGVYAERSLRLRWAAAEAGGGVLAQRLHTRTVTVLDMPSDGGPGYRFHYRSVTDPALRASVAFGPATGPLAGMRLALRSTHVWRDDRLANAYRGTSFTRELDVKGRRWQWQPEVGLGWALGF